MMRLFASAVALLACSITGVRAQEAPIDPSTARVYEAHATQVSGQVSRILVQPAGNEQPWALSSGERVPIQQVIATGGDGYAHFEVAGGSNFDLFSNSRVIFRQNAASAGDLLDVLAGRVKIHLQPNFGQPRQRIFTPVAILTAHQPATVALAIDEDDTVRIDVIEGQILVQHTLLPRNEPTLVRAIDAILVQKDQPISHRVDRGSIYRHKIWSAITLGHAGNHLVTQEKFLAMSFQPNL